MRFSYRLSSNSWLIVTIFAGALLFWLNTVRLHRVDYITSQGGAAVALDATSPTGYAGGARRLIIPEHNNDSYQWIAQTQQMLAQHAWHVRHISYDNAPAGRDVRSPSPYRWWLALVSWFDRLLTGASTGLGVERAARYADPVLHLLLLAGTTVFAARRFGSLPALMLGLGLATLFPLGGTFLPGQPGDEGMQAAVVLWCILPLLAGLIPVHRDAAAAGAAVLDDGSRARWFFVAGIAGGIGFWLSPVKAMLMLAGIALGGVITALIGRRYKNADASAPSVVLPWRLWALGGACTCLIAYLLEYFPGHMSGLHLQENHPLYGLAWLGLGELLDRLSGRLQGRKSPRPWRSALVVLLAFAALAVVPILLGGKKGDSLLAVESLANRLTNLPGSPIAQNFLVWLQRDGFTLPMAATLLPALLLIPGLWLLLRRQTSAAHRAAIAVSLGPVLVALVIASGQIRWWNTVDITLLALLVAILGSGWSLLKSTGQRLVWLGGLFLCLLPSLGIWLKEARSGSESSVTSGEVVALMERDLAYWLSNQAGPTGAIVLAPPNLTAALCYYGNIGGIGTPYWENREGFMAAIRIAGATSPDEAQAVARGRQLNYVVAPSWDGFLDEYARLGSNKVEHSLIAMLHQWLPPRWLQPVPYRLPAVDGFEDQSMAIFKVVDVQDNANALSRMTEYFLEMGKLNEAAEASQALRRYFTADLGAAVARTLVDHAIGDQAALEVSTNDLLASIARHDDQTLAWDRRVSLAIALAQIKRYEVARRQVQRCLAELDEPRLRSLTTVSLQRLLVMSKAFGLSITDPRLRTIAEQLLPAELRTP